MSVTLSMLGTQLAAASPSPSPSPSSSSGFSWGAALAIFVVVMVALLVLLAFVARGNRRLTYRPRLRTERDEEIREAAEEDIEAVEDDSWITRRDIPGSREDDL